MPYKKPKRRYLFCGIMQSQLSRQVVVANNLQITRVQGIQKFKRKGISDGIKIEPRK